MIKKTLLLFLYAMGNETEFVAIERKTAEDWTLKGVVTTSHRPDGRAQVSIRMELGVPAGLEDGALY